MAGRVRVLRVNCPNCGEFEPSEPGWTSKGDPLDPDSVSAKLVHDGPQTCGRCERAGRGKVLVLLMTEPAPPIANDG